MVLDHYIKGLAVELVFYMEDWKKTKERKKEEVVGNEDSILLLFLRSIRFSTFLQYDHNDTKQSPN